MSKQLLYKLLGILVIASFVLTACGGASATPESLPTPLPTNYTTISASDYGFSWSGPDDVAEKNGYITFTTNTMVVYIQSSIENKTVENFGDMVDFTVSVEETEKSTGYAAKKQPTCTNDNGGTINNGEVTRVSIMENGPYYVTCTLSNGDVVRGYATFGKLSAAGQTLTAMPTSSPTRTPVPTLTFTPTVTGTLPTSAPSATPTRTLQPTITNTATRTQLPTATIAPIVTKKITCSNKDQDVEYTVKGRLTGNLLCADGLTRQDSPVQTLVIPGAHGNINVTLDRVGGPQAMYATLITYIPGIYGTVTSTMTGTSIAEGHAVVSTTSNTLIRIQDGEVVNLDLAFGEFIVTAKASLR